MIKLNINTITKRFILAIVFFNITFKCRNKEPITNELKGISIRFFVDMINTENGEMFTKADSLIIYYYKQYIIYKKPYLHQFTNVSIQNDTAYENLISSVVKYRYFIHKAGDEYGYRFDSLNQSKGNKFKIDSFNRTLLGKNFNFYDNKIDTLLKFNINKTELQETYIPKIKLDSSYNDSSYFFYSSNLKSIPFSFYDQLDSVKNKKLYRVKLIFNASPKGANSFAIPKREILLEMNVIKISNPLEIREIIIKVRKDSK